MARLVSQNVATRGHPRRRQAVTLWASLGLGLALPAAASAQTAVGALPAVPPGNPIPRVAPRAAPSVSPGLQGLPATPPGGPVPNVPVAVATASVEGATAFTPARLARITAGLTGPAVPLPRIAAARLAILDLYRRHGYVLTAVSATLDAAHHLHFIVTEGRVVAVKLSGDIGPAGTQVLRFLHHLTQVRPITSAALERWLLLAQDIPGVSIRAVLQPSSTEPGALTLIAQVQRSPVSGLITADNRAFQNTGPDEGLAVFDLNSFTSLGEKTEISLYHTDGNTQNFGQIAESFFVGGSGLRVRLYGGAGHADPSGELAAIGYQGITTVFGAEVSYPLIRARQQTLNLRAAFDAIEAQIFTGGGPGGGKVLSSDDSLRVFRLEADYVSTDLWAGVGRSAVNSLSLRFSQGVPLFGAAHNGDLQASRLNERVDFWKINGSFSRTQTLFAPWPAATVALKGMVAGQVTSDVLPTSEEFFLGGADFTRGFYSGEVTGDNALAATAELQLNTGLQVHLFGHPFQVAAQFYGFYDWGETWQNQKTDANHRVSSAGGGVRLFLSRYTEFDLEAVARMTRHVDANTTTVKPLSADAVYWRVLARF